MDWNKKIKKLWVLILDLLLNLCVILALSRISKIPSSFTSCDTGVVRHGQAS